MITQANPPSLFGDSALWSPMTLPVQAFAQVVGTAAKELMAHHSETGASMFAASLASVVPAFAPGGFSFWIQQMPALYQSQQARLVQSMFDSVEICSRMQRELVDCGRGVLVLERNGSEVSGPTENRRVSAKVIDFPNRRAA